MPHVYKFSFVGFRCHSEECIIINYVKQLCFVSTLYQWATCYKEWTDTRFIVVVSM
jgi:hypothetical protein